jgi:hypothetical protein
MHVLRIQQTYIEAALLLSDGNVIQATRLLSINRTMPCKRMERMESLVRRA